jgi:hypothetical protein
MKVKILALGLICIFLIVFSGLAQVKEEEKIKEPATKLEAFLAKKGKLIIKEFYDLGKISGRGGTKIELTALVIFEPGQEKERVRGLRIEITEGGRYEREESAFLDLEEIESLLKAIDYMVNLSEKWKELKKEYTETVFSTKGDFNIGFYQQETNQAAFSSCGRIGKATCFFNSMNDLNSMKNITDEGLKLLNNK